MSTKPSSIDRRLSVAPMMDWTDRYCRYFHRILSPNAFLYSEMIHANAITRGDTKHHLFFRDEEKPVALQLGGIEIEPLREAAKRGEDYGYAEINLNCGCPSDRVRSGSFGACLMAEPQRVAHAVAEMQAAVKIPVTVKTRLGIDDKDSYEFLHDFVETVHTQGGCDIFILHARKAWLKGLSPKENRDKPPLHWDRVHRIKKDFPHLHISINGGFETVTDIAAQFDHVDGVMIGRKAYHEPYFLTELEKEILSSPLFLSRHPGLDPGSRKTASPAGYLGGFRLGGRNDETGKSAVQIGHDTILSRAEAVEKMITYMEDEKAKGTELKRIAKHMFGLFHAQPHSKAWKYALAEVAKTNSVAPLMSFL